ncbi:glycosyltransferase family 4 protein [Mucilaginibacter sp.]|uniref:glycosyltransferase family 4 protein n=1 Tax=Mucilaginibacter sp. TaxID=1882438 RepID=UPI0035BBB8D9
MPKTITVGVDIRDLHTAKTGTKTYLQELCKEFRKLEVPGVKFKFIDSTIPVYNGKNKILNLIGHFRYLVWKQLILPVKALLGGCDVVFCTDTVVPLMKLGFKTIPVFHDAFFFETPENYGKVWLWLYLTTALPAAMRSPFVVTPSAYAKKQINQHTNIPLNKLVVIAEGPKEINTITESSEILNQFNLMSGKYLLHVGSMFKRKNLPALIRAFSKIKADGKFDLKLVLAGSLSPASVESDHTEIVNAIDRYKLSDDVILTGYLPDRAVSQLYQSALVYVFPSINEGFGIPVLEAFQYNLPVIAADNTSLPEVGGNAIITFDPFDTDDIYLKIKTVLNDPELRSRLIAKGNERLNLFSWKKAALELVELFRKAV